MKLIFADGKPPDPKWGPVIPAISLWQPWATLVALAEKKIETRSWPTPIRGPLAIHAAKKWNGDLRRVCFEKHFRESLQRYQGGSLPLGAIIAVVTLADCVPIHPPRWSLCKISEKEFAFGNYELGRFAWVLRDIRPLRDPIPATGHQGIWKWEIPK